MDRVGAGAARGIDYALDREVALARGCRPDADHGSRRRGVRDVQRAGVGVREDGDRLDAHAPRGARDAAGDLAAIGDQKRGYSASEHAVSGAHSHIRNTPKRVSSMGAFSAADSDKPEHAAGIGGVDDAVVPQARGGVVGMALGVVLRRGSAP